ncbi:hypothetical protein ES708_30401 [subsurface metagenome]
MEEADEQPPLCHGGSEGLIQDQRSNQFKAECDGNDSPDNIHRTQPGRLQVVAADDPVAYQGYSSPRPSQVDRAEGDDSQSATLNQEENHRLSHSGVC